MNRPVIIAGASGMIGRDTVREFLSCGFRVISTGRTDPCIRGVEHWPTGLDYAPVIQKIQASRPMSIISLVGAEPNASLAVHNLVTFGSNHSLLLAAATIPDCRFVATGSAAEYGAVSHDRPLDETAARRPASHYGHAKAKLMDSIALAAENGQDAVGLRLFSLISPHAGEFSLAGRVRRQLFDPHSKTVLIGILDGARDMSPVHHVARAIAALANRPRRLPAWLNLGCGQATGLRLFVEEMIRCSGRQLELREGPLPEGVTRGSTLVADTSRLSELGVELPRYSADALARLALGLTSSAAPAMSAARWH